MKTTFLFLLLLAAYCSAQVVTVKDAATEKPLINVTVYANDPNRALTTDSYGKVNLNSFKGKTQIIFRLIGYKKMEISYDQIIRDNYEVFLNEEPISLSNIIISANRWNVDESEVSRTFELISPKDIAIQNPQTAADMLSQSGDIYVQKSQLGGGSPMIRGFATNRVLIVVDNVRMNNAIFRSGNLQNVISIDPNALANAEVVFGPGSVIYGSDAIGGVMDFSTLPAKFSYSDKILLNASALARYSSANNERGGNINFNIGLSNWGFLTNVSFSRFGDLRMGSNGPDDYLRTFYQDRVNGKDTMIINSDPEVQKLSGYDQLSLLQKIRFRPDENWEFNYGFYYSTTSDVPRYDRLIELKSGLPRDAQWYYGPQKWMMNNLAVTNYNSNEVYDLAKLIVAYQNFEESRHDRGFKKKEINHRTEKVNAFSLNLDFIKALTHSSELFYGAEAVINKLSSVGEKENIESGALNPISSRYPDGSIWNSFGVYASYKNKLSEEYIFETALRYNLIHAFSEFDTTFYKFPFKSADLTMGAFTGSAGISWLPNSSNHVYINIATGFRAPNIDDLGKVFDSAPGLVVVPNPNLLSEYIYSGELGWRSTVVKYFKIYIAAYYSYLDNALVRRDFTLNGMDSILYDANLSKVQAIQNAAFAYVWGVHLGFELNLSDGLRMTGKFNYQNGQEEDDSGNKVPLRHSAPWFGNTKIIYESGRLMAMVYLDYNGEIKYEDLAPTEREKTALYAKDENGNPYSPYWYTLNMKVSYRLSESLQLFGGAENITDKRYRPYSSGITAAGRNFIGSIKYTL
ncbi:MAG: TonB-dependent receptor [Ignavibacteriaceae bacterium]